MFYKKKYNKLLALYKESKNESNKLWHEAFEATNIVKRQKDKIKRLEYKNNDLILENVKLKKYIQELENKYKELKINDNS